MKNVEYNWYRMYTLKKVIRKKMFYVMFEKELVKEYWLDEEQRPWDSPAEIRSHDHLNRSQKLCPWATGLWWTRTFWQGYIWVFFGIYNPLQVYLDQIYFISLDIGGAINTYNYLHIRYQHGNCSMPKNHINHWTQINLFSIPHLHGISWAELAKLVVPISCWAPS